jgi:nucleotide-binding universal stress UspA family protein
MATTHLTEPDLAMTMGIGHPVVVGVDDSPASRAALGWAVDEAIRMNRPLHLVHAHPIQAEWSATPMSVLVPPPEEDRVLTEAIARTGEVADRAGVTIASPAGSPAAALVDASCDATEMVLGGPRHGALGSAVLGSTTIDVAAHALCPVVIVRAGLPENTVRRGIVVGSDGSEASRAAVGHAFRRANRTGLPLTVVHAWYLNYGGPALLVPELEAERRRIGERERVLTAAVVAQWEEQFPDVVINQEVVHGDPVQVLVEASADAEIVVVGTHGRGEVAGLFLGSVSQGLIRHATSPVMVVRPGVLP